MFSIYRLSRSGRSLGRLRVPPALGVLATSLGILTITGCSGSQSALAPPGREAERIANLFWWMTAISALVWLAVVSLTVYATRKPPGL
jgi:cytochrome c oxidase subunit II